MKRKNKLLIIIGIIIAVLAIILFNGTTGNVIKEDVTAIGAALPLEGVSSVYGQYAREGMELALEDSNVKIIYEDSKSQPSTAVSAFRNLIDLYNVPAVIVGASSPETLAQAPVAEENKVVLIATGSSAPKISSSGDYIFRLKVSADK